LGCDVGSGDGGNTLPRAGVGVGLGPCASTTHTDKSAKLATRTNTTKSRAFISNLLLETIKMADSHNRCLLSRADENITTSFTSPKVKNW
jgi:hypothetical protein